MRSYLTQQLDDDLRSAGDRARGQYVAGSDDGPAVPDGPPGPAAPDTSAGTGGEVCQFGRDDDDRRGDGDGDEPGRVPGQAAGTLSASVREGYVVFAEVIEESGCYAEVPESAYGTLSEVASERLFDDGGPRTDIEEVDLPGLGEYRLLTEQVGSTTLVNGLPTESVDRTVVRVVVSELVLILLGVGVAGALAVVLVRRQMRPLRQVAATAHDVAAVPLSQGEVGATARVPEELTDDRTEVGQVGSALNTLLDHVEDALRARHASEQQVRQFVADASHELRTPLATIKGYAELTRRTTPEDEQAALRQAMGKVEVEAERMSSLVEDLLLLARLDAGRPLERRPVDLTRLVLEDVADARVLAPEHRWVIDLGEEPVVVEGDEQRLHQSLVNLLGNARRHTPPGTTVTVRLTPGVAGHGAELVVHDDGPGIDPALAGRVFERFARGDAARTRASGSVGLGLSLVQAIVAAHRGEVSLDSRPGSTAFTVRLP
ncbi:HAMP domain-containing histidine kinase [Nocardioides sp. HDW12B]|nr:HAMP domain-containing histidine kinase [Nocardioides sp. HDW12B]